MTKIGDHALFAEMGSSPASMEAAKLLDAYGSQPGYSKEQADAVQAYVQALFKGHTHMGVIATKQVAEGLGLRSFGTHSCL